jgi:tetrahydromethanopterin S-methyltransferase subunit G
MHSIIEGGDESMTIEQAKKRIEELEKFIDMIENYQADNFEKAAIKLYVLEESVSHVATELNKQGYRVGNRKVIGKDVSDVIRSKATDSMHEMAKKMFGKHKRKAARSW